MKKSIIIALISLMGLGSLTLNATPSKNAEVHQYDDSTSSDDEATTTDDSTSDDSSSDDTYGE